MVKAVFLDLDGTMLPFGSTQARPKTVEALLAAKRQGIRLFVATGRHLPNISGVPLDLFDGFVSLNGQYCVTDGEVIHDHAFRSEDVRQIVSWLDEDPFVCAFLEEDRAYINRVSERFLAVSEMIHLGMEVNEDYRDAWTRKVYQMLFFMEEGEEEAILTRFGNLSCTRWHPYFVDIVPAGGGKDAGLQAMCRHYSLDPSEVIAIGDGENDISMLSWAGIGVAMGQASEQVKAVADHVTSSVAEDGVYEAFVYYGIGDLPPLSET